MAKTLSATERMERSRSATKSAIARELLYAGILARIWPSYVCDSRTPQVNYPYVLCVETPQGLLTWRLSRDEAPAFDHLPERDNPGTPSAQKEMALAALASEGW